LRYRVHKVVEDGQKNAWTDRRKTRKQYASGSPIGGLGINTSHINMQMMTTFLDRNHNNQCE